jgi:Rab GDP dissociation inhibitor
MANGKLVKMLLHTKVTRYLEWKCVDGSYVVQHQAAGWLAAEKMAVCKVPSNDMEALKSNLLGMFEKKRIIGMYKFINTCVIENPMTWDGFDINQQSMMELFEKYQLEENTIDFLGHAIAL